MSFLYLVKSDRNKRVGGGGGGSVVVSLLPILPSVSDLILYLIKDVFGCQNIFFEIILVQISSIWRSDILEKLTQERQEAHG